MDQACRLLGTRKIGHAGSLDPLATGILPLCIGRATKIVQYLMKVEKEYVAVARLGQTTATLDAESPVVSERPVPPLSLEDVDACARTFTGRITQIPPAYSAKKVGGQRSYDLARSGKVLALKPIEVTVHAIECVRLDLPFLELRIRCSHGTYIRTLCADIGERWGCGAHVVSLRRTRQGPFSEEDAVPLAAWAEMPHPESRILSLAETLSFLPACVLEEDEAMRLCRGQRVPVKSSPPAGTVRVVTPEGRLIGLALAGSSDTLVPVRIFEPHPPIGSALEEEA